MHETLLSSEEKLLSSEMKDYFVINPDIRDMNYSKFFKNGKKVKNREKYSSNQKKLLNIKETISLLKKSEYVKKEI